MFEILKLRLQGFSAYKIARKLNLDPPTVYRGLNFAEKNFAEVGKMLTELKALGWPEKLPEVESQISRRAHQNRTVAQETVPTQSEEIAFKLG
ncbi:helix-turn-helix domain-containing protein [Candidatus Bathyarchaeota archaeon]|nr:helix-turn-helix domain-containing protein [Candidatus Bathyarchaeota archaeon]